MDDRQLATVQAMQAYIVAHQEGFTLEGLAAAVGYSPRHCMRLFKQGTGRTIPETLRLLRLSDAAGQLLEGGSILDTALDGGFGSHEGFTKAFRSAFGTTPSNYRRGGRPIPLFVPYPVYPPVESYYKERSNMQTQTVVTVTLQERPARKLAFLPAKNATDYFSYCGEVGCEWEGLLSSIPEKLDMAALVTLPPSLVPEGYCAVAGGIELPADYTGRLPDGYRQADLPAATLLVFQSAPFEREEDFPAAISAAFQAYSCYDYETAGCRPAPLAAPFYNYGAFAESGARLAAPVERIKK